jgi:hypothetical protein
MTDEQKQKIMTMLPRGDSMPKIAKDLGVSVNTVKSFCRRFRREQAKSFCKHCGKFLTRISGKKPKTFCGDRCRYAWWSAHRSQLKHKNTGIAVCAGCGCKFKYYGKNERKYCSHSCYIADRYGGKDDSRKPP